MVRQGEVTNLKHCRKGMSIVEGIVGLSIAAIGLTIVAGAQLDNQKKLKYLESRNGFLQSRFLMGQILREHGKDLCDEVYKKGLVFPTSAEVLAAKEGRTIASNTESILVSKALPTTEKYSKKIVESTPKDVAVKIKVLADPFECIASGSNQERCYTKISVAGEFVNGGITPSADVFDALFEVDTSGGGRKISSCTMGTELEPQLASTAVYEIASENTTQWGCAENIDLEPYCSGDRGCTLTFNMQHKGYFDMVRTVRLDAYFEQINGNSNNVQSGIFGHIFNGYYSSDVNLNNDVKYNMINLRSWSYMINYKHGACHGPQREESQQWKDGLYSPSQWTHWPNYKKYVVGILSHPWVKTKLIIKRN